MAEVGQENPSAPDPAATPSNAPATLPDIVTTGASNPPPIATQTPTAPTTNGSTSSLPPLSSSPSKSNLMQLSTHRPNRLSAKPSLRTMTQRGNPEAGTSTLPPEPSHINIGFGKKYLHEQVFMESFLQIEGEKLSQDIFNLIFDILVASSHKELGSHKKSVEVDFFVIFIHLLMRSERSLQVGNARKVLELLHERPSLIQYAIHQDWLRTLLHHLPKFQSEPLLNELSALIETLGSGNISVHHVKKIFNLFQKKEEGPFKVYYWNNIFQLLQKIWDKKEGPSSYFEFEGNTSGIIIPPIQRWPANGYTFFLWFRVESWSSPYLKITTPYTPYLFSFINDQGVGIDCYFDRRKLAFKSVHKKNKENKPTYINYNFQERTWYFLGGIHKPGWLAGRSSIRITINDYSETFNFSYPKTDKPMTVGRIGISTYTPDQSSHSFRGRIGGMVLLEEVLSDESMTELHNFGGDFFSNLLGIEQVLSNQRTGFLKGAKPKPLYFYSPKAVEGKVLCVDAYSRDSSKKSTKFGGVSECRITSLQQSLFCVGGITVLLPLFSLKHRPTNTDNINLNIQLIKLITKIIQGHDYYQNEMQRSQFFPIMGFLLCDETELSEDSEVVTQNIWSPEAVQELEVLGNAIYLHKPLYKQFFYHVFTNFKIWSKTPFQVQQQLLSLVQNRASANPQEFRYLAPVSYFLDILSDYYCVPYDRSVPIKSAPYFELSRAQRHELRISLLSIIRTLVLNGITFGDTKRIVMYLESESQKRTKDQRSIDVLQLLLTLLTEKVKGIFEHLYSLGYFRPFLALLCQKENEQLIIWTLKILGTLLTCALKGVITISNNKITFQDTILRDFSAIKKYLSEVHFTQNIYSALLEISVGRISVKGLENVVERAKRSEKVPDFQVPVALSIIFHLANLTTDESLKCYILNDMIYLLRRSPENRRIFLSQQHWQDWLLSLISKENECEFSADGTNDETQTYHLVIHLFAILFAHALLIPEGYEVFIQSKLVMRYHQKLGFVHLSKLARAIHTTVAESLEFKNKEALNKFLAHCTSDPKLWLSVVEWLFFVDESLFFLPSFFTQRNDQSVDNSILSDSNDTPLFATEDSNGSENVYQQEQDEGSKLIDRESIRPLHVHMDKSGLWIDLLFAHRFVDFVETLIEKAPIINVDSTFSPNPSEQYANNLLSNQKVNKMVERLNRLHMRLIIYTLNEATSFENYYNVETRKDRFKNNLHNLVATYFNQNQFIIRSMKQYLEGKTKQWSAESSDVNSIVTKALNDLSNCISYLHRASRDPISKDYMFYIVACIHHTLIQSPSSHTHVKTILQSLIGKVATCVKTYLIKFPEFNEVNLEIKEEMDFVQFFLVGLDNPDSFPLTEIIKKSVSSIVGLEVNSRLRIDEEIEKSSDAIRISIEKTRESEVDHFMDVDGQFKKTWNKFCKQAQKLSRRRTIEKKEMASYLDKAWKRLLRELTNPRGTWATLVKKHERKYWKLDGRETANRRKLLLVRDYSDKTSLELASKSNDKIFDQMKVQAQTVAIPPSPALESSTSLPFIKVSVQRPRSELPMDLTRDEEGAPLKLKHTIGVRARSSRRSGMIFTERPIIDGESTESLAPLSPRSTPTPSPTIKTSLPDIPDEALPVPLSTSTSTSTEKIKTDAIARRQSKLAPKSLPIQTTTSDMDILEEKTKLNGRCTWVKGVDSDEGEYELTTKAFYFRNLDKMIFRSISLDSITKLYRRNYMLRSTAIEIFTKNNRSYFFVFEPLPEVSKVVQAIFKLRPPFLEDFFSLPAAKLLKKMNITELWRRRQISNFDYLMELNTIAGRTYNDLSQYPVFPWIIADYTSSQLDLSDPKVYRDLTKPIGALNEARLEKIMERYFELVEQQEKAAELGDVVDLPPPFMYGTHYSSPAVVIFYLVRLEPYTTNLLNLQSGKFDHPMRMFWSIPETWQGCLTNPMDVKELIPEFFYNPAFLSNVNDINLGTAKTGAPIGDIVLPPWSQGSPETFVQMNRRALESEYVSQNLHHWIDLIFGYKQTGDAAVESRNLFYYLSYEGAIDLDSIENPDELKSISNQIINFGQTPTQLMTTPHPPRMSIEEVIKENMTIGETLTDGLTNFTQIATNTAAKLHNRVISGSPLSNLPVSTQTKRKKEISKEATVPREMKEIKRDATSDNDEVFTFSPYPGDNSPPLVYVYPYKGDRVVLVYMDGGIFKTSWRIPTFPGMHPGRPKFILQAIEKPTQFLPFLFSHRIDTNRLHANFAVLGDSILSGGHWDDFLLCGNVVSGAVISQIGEHKDVVSCMGISDDGTILATGSLDCTCLIWETSSFDQKTLTRDELPKPKLILYGQDRPINCVDVSTDLDLVITGSSDGVCILYELSKGSFLRTLKHQDPVHLVKLSTQGVIVTYCESINFNEIYLHSINGNRLAQFPTTTTIYCMLVTEDGDYLVSGGESGCVIVQSLYSLNLKIVQEWKCKSKILSLALTEQKVQRPRFLMVGLDTGEFRVIRFDPATFRPV